MTTVGPNAPGTPTTLTSRPSSMVDPTVDIPVDTSVGQEGSRDAGTPLPGPDDPGHHLAIIAGLMSGKDNYNVVQDMPQLSQQGLTNRTLDNYASSFQGIQSSQPPTVNSPTQGGQGVIDQARKYLGQPYVYGGLDCSGLVQRAFAAMGISLPRVTYDQVKVGRAIGNSSELQPGDLIFFWGDKGNRMNGHVGIFAGGGTMINAPHTGAVVRYDHIDWSRVTAMRRVLP